MQIAGRNMSEAQFQQLVIDAAFALNWMVYHTFDSRRSFRGFPDLVLVRDGKMLALELKTANGRVRPEQEQWIAELADVPGVTAMIARPDDWEKILALLQGEVA